MNMTQPSTSFLHRRQFLVRTGLLLGLGASGSPFSSLARGERPRRGSIDSWEDVRSQFSIDRSFIHMSSFFLASHPRAVREAIERHRQGLDANPFGYLWENEGPSETGVLTAAARYLGVQPDDIALTDSTTMGLGLLYGAISIRSGKEIVYTEHDHYSTEQSIRHRADRTGASVRRIRLYRDPSSATVDEIVQSLRDAIRQETRLVAVTWVHSSTGVKLPIREMAQTLAELNAARDEGDRVLLSVDGVHGLGVEDVDLSDFGADFFIAGTHKWMFGPRGTGIVWARTEAWPLANPVIPTFDIPTYEIWMKLRPPQTIPYAATMTPGGFHSFEHRWALNEAFDFHMQIGKKRIMERIHELNTRLKQGLAAMPHIKLHTPMSEELSAGIVCFEVEGLDAIQVAERLASRRIIASVTPYATLYARLSPSLLTSESDVDVTLEAVRQLA